MRAFSTTAAKATLPWIGGSVKALEEANPGKSVEGVVKGLTALATSVKEKDPRAAIVEIQYVYLHLYTESVDSGMMARANTSYCRGTKIHDSHTEQGRRVVTANVNTAQGTRLVSAHIYEDGTFKAMSSRAGKKKQDRPSSKSGGGESGKAATEPGKDDGGEGKE
ncbi:hypothetical protein LTR17_001102 [Elasticomyces elasticus]|nr:hypothetical protein LTR17_001102 [Elasticomyces elasticus]